ncbi:major facilitator superfamily domain-containing protein [Aspergillus bertholletiae]|uniref:Major facilitator superfamily domain-containing protein n=1 Tax=Aspergillus bertholletiae TaxID=1226010 RepID=A0A5N7BKQ4_9EURO|nr:major facilitator superfamily domain-containing protein [Aspergillus bertholletiae]
MDQPSGHPNLAEQGSRSEEIPGTEIMFGAHKASKSNLQSVLSPQPSNDPRDPLNWSRGWKYIAVTAQLLFLFVAVESALSMGPMFPFFAEEFSLNETEQNLLTGVCVLALGFSNFIIVPCSNIFGRRVTSLICCLLGAGTCIWQALASSYSSLLAARVVNGVATATSETILVQVVSDVFYLHERGVWTGVYFMGYFWGLFIGPVISGNVAQRFGWRSFFWLSLAMTVFNLMILLVGFPETKFNRPARPSEQLPAEKHQTEDDCKPELNQIETVDSTPAIGSGRPSIAQFKVWQMPDPRWKSFILRDIFAPIHVFLFPIILWAGLNVAGPANILLYWNLTESPVLGAPPYNFSPSAVGYSNFAFAVGGIIGLVTAGPLSDWVAMQATNRNHGIREAEMRLPALIPFFITTAIGLVIGGLGYDRHWDWPVLLIIGYGFSGLCVTAVPTIAIAYAVDCYKPISGEIMVVATVIKNTCGFAMSYWVTPLAAREGWMVPTMVEFALTIGPMLLGIPIYLFGKSLRRLTRNSSVHLYEE